MPLEIISKINEYALNFYSDDDDDDDYNLEDEDDEEEFEEYQQEDVEFVQTRDEFGDLPERPALELYGTDITGLASQGKLDECFGREKELLEMMEILVRRQKNNPVLVGDAGVGKTAIVELFAARIVKNLVPFVLAGRTIVSLDLARIVAGSRYRGEFELRFQRVLDEVLAQPNIIIFIDEIHNIGGTGSAEGSLDAANILKPVLSRSGFQCIGATTTKEYQRIEKDPALNRRFQPIKVKEPTIDETINILYGLRPSLEAFHNIEIVPGAIRLAAELSARYIHDRFLPDKAIDLLDRAAAKEVIRLTNVTEGSVIGAFVNSSLNSIGTLRVEAFRRGDIGAEFIFQEIENAYRNFLLQWLEDPSCIPETSLTLLSPISEQLFTKMRLSVLRRVDELLFASINPSLLTTVIEKTEDLSPKKNQELYWELKWGTLEDLKFPLSLYRISVYLFCDWIQSDESGWLEPYYYNSFIGSIQSVSRRAGFLDYIRFLRDKLIVERTDFKFFTLKDEVEAAKSELNYYVNEGLEELIEEHRLERIEAGLESEPKIYPQDEPFRFSDDDDYNVKDEPPTRFRKEYIQKQEQLRQLTLEVEEAEKELYELNRSDDPDVNVYDRMMELAEMGHYNYELAQFSEEFFAGDIEAVETKKELLSELETKRIEIFKEFLFDLKPLLRKGMIESLKYSSQIQLSDDELALIYNLLGHFGSDQGRTFLSDLDNPELIREARKLGNFSGLKTRITQLEIRELLSHITGIPVQSISNVESQKLLNLEATLHQRVVGQEEAISAISRAIRRSRLGIQNPNRPLASFLFCGPTGVGKTEVTKALAVSMFGSENDMIRFDMSEFMEKFTVSRLIGSPPGYVGYDEGGQLTDAVRAKPYSVVLFDEIEKAHPDILNILLQILEDGRLTDTHKRLIQFDNTIIIMTSNAAADEIQQIIKLQRNNSNSSKSHFDHMEGEIQSNSDDQFKNNKDYRDFEDPYAGVVSFLESPITENFLVDIKTQLTGEFEKSFRKLHDYEILEERIREANQKLQEREEGKNNLSIKALKEKERKIKMGKGDLKAAVLERLSSLFLPEFLNRLDDIIIFEPLKPEELRKICDIMVNEVTKRVKTKNISLIVEENVCVKLSREGYNPLFGARPLRRLITKYIEDLISENMLQNPVSRTERFITLTLNENDQVVIKKEEEESFFNLKNSSNATTFI